jgi:hypothetical protein
MKRPSVKEMLERPGAVIIDPLMPYLAVHPLRSGPPGRDEWPAHCPLHEDAHPSMSINFRKGVWFCHAGCGGGRVVQLLDCVDNWVPKDRHPAFRHRGR